MGEYGGGAVRGARETPLHTPIGDDDIPNLGHLTRDLW